MFLEKTVYVIVQVVLVIFALFPVTLNSHSDNIDGEKTLPTPQDYMQYRAQNNYCQANSISQLILDEQEKQFCCSLLFLSSYPNI